MIGRFLGQRSAKYLHPAMDTIVGHIEAMTGRKPDRIFTDREKVFDDFQTYKRVKVTHSAPNRHARIAERNIETVKRAMRSTLASLPFKLPSHLFRYLVDWVIQRRNLLINTKSSPLTPAEIYGCKQFSLQELLRTQFGTAGFFKIPRDQIKDDLAPQTEFGIIIGYESNRPANLKVYVPSRNEVFMRSHYKPAQLTRELIDALSEEDADTDNEFVWPDDSPTSEGDNPTSEGASEINVLRAADGDHEPPADSLFNLTVKEAYSTLDTSDVDNSMV